MNTSSTPQFGSRHPYDLLLVFVTVILLLLAPGPCLQEQWQERLANGDTVQPQAPPLTNAPVVAANPAHAKGKALFKANCSSCHSASAQEGTGPGLLGVLGRIPGGDWKYRWVKNSSETTATGDAYALKIKAKYNNVAMTAFPALSNEDIDAILTYADAGN